MDGTQTQRPPVRVTYLGRRTIAATSGYASPEQTPPRGKASFRGGSVLGERQVAPDLHLPNICEILKAVEENARQKQIEREQAREALRRSAFEHQLRTTPFPDHDVVSQMLENLERNGECAICLMTMTSTPYILVCGHSFCGSCLKSTFEAILMKKLRGLKHRMHFGHDGVDSQKVPKTAAERERLAECFKLHGIKPEEVFQYPCPMCRFRFSVAPAANTMLHSVLGALVESVQGGPPLNFANVGSSKPSSESFAGLFIGCDV